MAKAATVMKGITSHPCVWALPGEPHTRTQGCAHFAAGVRQAIHVVAIAASRNDFCKFLMGCQLSNTNAVSFKGI